MGHKSKSNNFNNESDKLFITLASKVNLVRLMRLIGNFGIFFKENWFNFNNDLVGPKTFRFSSGFQKYKILKFVKIGLKKVNIKEIRSLTVKDLDTLKR